MLAADSTMLAAEEVEVEQKFEFFIPRQAADVALTEFAEQADLTLIFPDDLVRGKSANALIGRYTRQEGIDTLLAGTGLIPRFSNKLMLSISTGEQSAKEGNNMNLKKKTGLLMALASLFAGNANTQEPEVNRSESARGGLEEIVVTATKREEVAQDVGKAINVFDSEALDKGGIQDISRLELITPGLAFAQRGNDFKLTLRGANAENTDRAEPVPIGVFVDGLYRVRSAQAGNAFLDVASVEVLKGPQGTLFGRNTLGGAVLIKTNRPDNNENNYSLNFSTGNYSLKKVEGIANLALSDNFAIRIAASIHEADGWIENLGSSNDLGEVDDKTIRISALWDVNENMTALLSHFSYDSGGSALGAYGYQSRGTLRDPNSDVSPIQDRQTHANGIHDPVNSRGGSLGTRGDLGPWQVFRDSPFIRDVTEDTTSLELIWDLGGINIKSLTSYTDYYNLAEVDGDYSEGRLLEESRLDDMQAFSQELLVSGNTDNTEWVTGLYYSGEDFTQAFFRNWLGFASATVDGAPDPDNCGGALAFAVQATAAVSDPNNPDAVCPGQFAGNPSDLENRTLGLFVHGSFNISERTRVSTGIRYSKDEMDYLGSITHLSTDTLGETTRSDRSASSNESWSQVTWELGYEMDIFEDSLFYASVSTGFLAGSYNPNGSTFDQQEVIAYELGLKNRLMDNRIELNLSAYRNEFTDMLAGILDANSLTQKVNGGSINANGLEVDLKALVGDNLTVVANLALQDSKYDEFGAANRFQLGSTGPVGFYDLSGLDTPWAPSVSGNLSLSYDMNTEAGLFTPHVQVSYSGSHWTTGLQQFALAEQDAYAKLDLRLYWKSAGDHWTAQAYVENATEEEVLQHTIVGGSDIVQVSWGKPRMYGVKVGYNF